MMKQLIVFFAIIIISSVVYCQNNEVWQWSISAGSNFHDIGRSIATDNEGNSYVVGNFTGIATFGSFNLGSYDVNYSFIGKLNSNGVWMWVNYTTFPASVIWQDILVDEDNNILIVGYFSGSVTYGTTTLSSAGQKDILVAKLNSDGNCIWATKAGGIGEDLGRKIELDALGNIYVIGEFSDSATFGSVVLNSSPWADGFAAKIDTVGNWLWAKQIVCDMSINCYGIAIDSANKIYITGTFNGTASFGGTVLSSVVTTSFDIFLCKLDNDGNWLWANRAGGSYYDSGNDVKTCKDGYVYLTGSFTESAAFGTLIVSCNGGYDDRDIFVAKADSNGYWIDVTRSGSLGSEGANSLALDKLGHIFITGSYNSDIYVSKLNSDLDWLWTKIADNPGSNWGNKIAVDNNANVYLTGCIKDVGNWDNIFVAKLGHNSPVAYFYTDLNSGYMPLTVNFYDYSLSGNSPFLSWHWEFGDGNISDEQNPTHIYQNEGFYTVSLTVTNVNDSTDTLIRQDFIHVLPRNPEITIAPSSVMAFGTVNLTTQSVMDLWIRNIGAATLSLDSLAFCLTNSPFEVIGLSVPFEISEGDSTAIQIRFTPLVAGAVTDSLIVYNNSVNLPRAAIRLSGTGQYVPPLPPENVNLVMDGSNAIISWDAVTETELHTPIVPDYYLVFFNGSSNPDGLFYFLASVSGLTYTHFTVGLHSPNMFYRVRAYKYYGRGDGDITSLGLVPGMREDEVMGKLRIEN